MRKFFKTAALVVIGAIILVFAITNRQDVVFSLDPLGSLDPTKPLVFGPMPLFVLVIAAIVIGVLIGGFGTWVRQGKWRRLARQADADARTLRADNDRLRREMERTAAPQIAPPMSPGAISAQHSD